MLELRTFKDKIGTEFSETGYNRVFQARDRQDSVPDIIRMKTCAPQKRRLPPLGNDTLNFLVDFLSDIGGCLDLDELLKKAASGFRNILPLRSLHAVLWDKNGKSVQTISLRIGVAESSPERALWRDALLEQARNALGNDLPLAEERCVQTRAAHKNKWLCLSGNGSLLALPLIDSGEHFGQLLLLLDSDSMPDREQAQALDAAVRHLALNMRNAEHFITLLRYANHDALTGVHNRRHFDKRLEEEFSRFKRYGYPLSLLMVDIDHFKNINDTRGHQAGDAVLREVAAVMMGSIRATDYCARYGGEEFAIILPYTSTRKAVLLAERIRNSIAGHDFTADAPLRLTVSIGVCGAKQDAGASQETLLSDADAALYAAKSGGRNRVALIPSPRPKPARR
ncbi:MAG: GGDEF domain-containing protein [Desulfovibrio sp.]|jgi:diguanylate cyclase (GGDEF)-like protein|nr:GGDEF domain-containing protein [Desulfovibrio sp.]